MPAAERPVLVLTQRFDPTADYVVTELNRRGAARMDWRRDHDSLRYSSIEIPESIRTGLLNVMHGLLLRFAAADFIVTADGHWVFLEVNPNGQWAFIEDATGQPITAAIADALERNLDG